MKDCERVMARLSKCLCVLVYRFFFDAVAKEMVDFRYLNNSERWLTLEKGFERGIRLLAQHYGLALRCVDKGLIGFDAVSRRCK